jgi:hypothetical protein
MEVKSMRKSVRVDGCGGEVGEHTRQLGMLEVEMAGSTRSSLLAEQTGKLPATALEVEVAP